MKKVDVRGSTGSSVILVGENLENLHRYLPDGRCVILTDTRVQELYGRRFPAVDVIAVGTGEGIKTLETVREVYDRLVSLEADRTTFLIGIGGGIVCDLAGFVASTYLRGVPFGFVASTLLAQVDASVGGKNGVNFAGYKNLVGTFNQPAFVICDPVLLHTLPQEEVQCGMAEVVKHAAIADAGLFAALEKDADRAVALDREVMERLVHESVVIKADVVNRDEKEKGERRKLNFGHTLGHALEKVTGISHGRAVSLGMVFAAELSVRYGMLSEVDAMRLRGLLQRLNLPDRLRFDRKAVLEALGKDKKREGDAVYFVLLEKLGRATVRPIPLRDLRETAERIDWAAGPVQHDGTGEDVG
ncbi:MAG: 3-dehydroquinate synthase [Desulfobacteraceae bacterium]|nr:3-dehydroquinate synthase [Desulfobacteraceae bacterium]